MKKKFIIIFIIIILFFSVIFLFSCKKKSGLESEYQIEEDDSIDIVIGTKGTEIDWDAEKEKLKGIGKINNVKDFCTIMVLWRKELDKEGYNLLGSFTEEQTKKIEELKKTFFSYFGITTEQFDSYANENKNAIDQFILSNPVYQDALISIQGSSSQD